MEETISIKEILQSLKKHLSLIVGIILVSITLVSIITFFFITPKYEASTQILVNQSQTDNEDVSSADIQSSRELISTYNVIMTSPAILEPVIERSNFEGSVGDLRSKINVQAEEESQVATVTIEDNDPRVAVTLANTLAQTFESEINNIMDVDNVSILAEAQLSDSNSPVSPQPFWNLVIGLMIGIIIGAILSILLEYLDKSIKSEEDVERELNLPILGIVPLIDKDGEEKLSNKNISAKSRTKKRDEERKTF